MWNALNLVIVNAAAATGVTATEELGVSKGTFENGYTDLVIWITNLLIIVGAGVVLIMLALGFIRYITSQGDKTAVDTAQKWLTYAVVGAIGLFLVYAIRSILFSLIGVTTAQKVTITGSETK